MPYHPMDFSMMPQLGQPNPATVQQSLAQPQGPSPGSSQVPPQSQLPAHSQPQVQTQSQPAPAQHSTPIATHPDKSHNGMMNSPSSDYNTNNSVNGFNTTVSSGLSPNPCQDSNYLSSGDDKSPKTVKQVSKATSSNGESSVMNSPPHQQWMAQGSG